MVQSESAAADGGFIAIADIATVLAHTDYRLIGGGALMLHSERLSDMAPRMTADADVGVRPLDLRDGSLIERIESLGYMRVAGNRWERVIDERTTASVDFLVPAYTSKVRKSFQVGDVNTTEVGGLAEANQRPPVMVDATLILTNGQRLNIVVAVPDEVSLLVIKAHARHARRETRDSDDLRRCLELINLAGKEVEARSRGDLADVMATLRAELSSTGAAMTDIVRDLDGGQAAMMVTRVQALLAAIDPALSS